MRLQETCYLQRILRQLQGMQIRVPDTQQRIDIRMKIAEIGIAVKRQVQVRVRTPDRCLGPAVIQDYRARDAIIVIAHSIRVEHIQVQRGLHPLHIEGAAVHLDIGRNNTQNAVLADDLPDVKLLGVHDQVVFFLSFRLQVKETAYMGITVRSDDSKLRLIIIYPASHLTVHSHSCRQVDLHFQAVRQERIQVITAGLQLGDIQYILQLIGIRQAYDRAIHLHTRVFKPFQVKIPDIEGSKRPFQIGCQHQVLVLIGH